MSNKEIKPPPLEDWSELKHERQPRASHVFVVRLLFSLWVFTYGGNSHSLSDVWFSRRKGQHEICAWGGAQPAHCYVVSEAWDLLWNWSFKWRFDSAIERLDKKYTPESMERYNR